MSRRAWVALAFVAGACGGGGGAAPGPDGGSDAPGCEACDDGLFCNGLERCVDGACAPGEPPCEAGCDEAGDACSDCVDADGDGRASTVCGGEDCDDDDPNVFPGSREICDPAGVDEDCDPTTVGDRDADRDGYEDAACCNGERCGDDCDDAAPNVHPTAPEVCNGRDDDCDGSVDEGVLITFFRDADGDNYGADDQTVTECSQPSGFVARGGDCADDPVAEPAANERNPGESEVCDEADQDCDGRVDEGVSCECTLGVDTTRACGFDPALDGVGNCRLGTQSCGGSGQWSICGGGLVAPTEETCNGDDDDCDGMADEGVRTTCWRDADGDGFAASGDPTMVICGACPMGHTPTDPAMAADCDDGDDDSYPGAPELCDRLDNDCSRASRDEPSEDADRDGHAPVGARCEGGFPKDDCRDDEPRAFPGQTQYFGVGYCPESHPCPCNGGCNAVRGAGRLCELCLGGSTPDVGASVFDFDCDGVATRRANAMSAPSCACGGGFACDSTPYYSYGRFAFCGQSVTRYQCVGGCPCSLSTTSAPLPCR